MSFFLGRATFLHLSWSRSLQGLVAVHAQGCMHTPGVSTRTSAPVLSLITCHALI